MKFDLTAICVTYGRPEVLCEMLGSVVRQSCTHRVELLLHNDHQQQELVIPRSVYSQLPEWLSVRVENTSRFRNLGAKYNAAVELAQCDNVCMIDDDDLCLPDKFERMISGFKDGIYGTNPMLRRASEGFLFEAAAYWLHWNYAYSKALFSKIGGYREPPEQPDLPVSFGLKDEMDRQGRELDNVSLTFYRSSAAKYQTSRLSPGEDGLNKRIDAALGKLTTGTIEIYPKVSHEQLEIERYKCHNSLQ